MAGLDNIPTVESKLQIAPARRRMSLVIVIIWCAMCMTAACDRWMRVRVAVADRMGVPVPDSEVRLLWSTDSSTDTGWITPELTSSEGLADMTRSYGFRSGAYTMKVSRPGYKAYATKLEPQPRYRCRVTLVAVEDAGVSTGECVRVRE